MENRKDQKPNIQKEAVWILKSLLCAYVVTGILLLLLALFAYKLNLGREAGDDCGDDNLFAINICRWIYGLENGIEYESFGGECSLEQVILCYY